jgi:hypothetical protein
MEGRQRRVKGQSQDVPVKSADRQALQHSVGPEDETGPGVQFVSHFAKLNPINAVANPVPGDGFMD